MGDTFNPSAYNISENPNTSTVGEVNSIRRRMSPMIFLNTRFIQRTIGWSGALNQNTRLGCGLNVLHFLGILSHESAVNALQNANVVHPVNGLSLNVVVQKFNELFQSSGINRQVQYSTTNIQTREDLRNAFSYFQTILVPDSCILVRYGRHADPQQRIRHPDPDPQLLLQYPAGVPISEGHYVIIAKKLTGELTTIDPHASQIHDYTGTISDNFWNVWHNTNGYISIEFLHCYDPNVLAGGTPKSNAVYIVPNKVMKHFVNDLLNSYECVYPEKTRSQHRSQSRSKTKNRRKSLDAKPSKKRDKTRRTI
jgi:hypothetical protein